MNEDDFQERVDRKAFARLQHDPVWLYGTEDEQDERRQEVMDTAEAEVERELRDYPPGFDEQYDREDLT